MHSKSSQLSLVICLFFLFLLTAFSCSKKSTGTDEDDGTSPSRITDLKVASFTHNSVTLSWTAPGDDSTSGTAARYDIRYSTLNNLWTDWDSVIQVSLEPAPQKAGATESFTITDLLTDTTYYFGINTFDESNNSPGISNVVSATCFDDFVVSFADSNLEKTIREAINKPNGDINKSDLLTIQSFWAEGRGILNLSGMERCTNLLSLGLQDNNISDISSLAGLTKLTGLNLGSNSISDISSLASLINLSDLSLWSNQVSVISSLASLTNLKTLNLMYNEIADIGSLVDNSGLNSGDEVMLNNNPLSYQAVNEHIPALQARGVTVYWDLDTIPPATVSDFRLETLTATSVIVNWTAPGDDGNFGVAYEYELRYALDSITVINWTAATPATGSTSPQFPGTVESMEITGLTTDLTYYLALKTRDESDNWSKISNIISATPFEDFVVNFPDTNLEATIREKLNKPTGSIYKTELLTIQDLQADGKDIVDLSGLEHCGNLQVLNLENNQIVDVGPLASLNELRYLNLGKNKVTSINPLANLFKLEELILNENGIVDISPLSGLSNLQSLQLKQNQIIDISPLSGLVELEYLFLYSNKIAQINALSSLTNLIWLDLMNNEISDISPLTGLSNLKYLFLNVNQISNISPLGGLTDMRILYADINQISDISALSTLTNLETLYLRYNQITDIYPLVQNSGLSTGDEVGLGNNPLSETSINQYIPALQARGVTVYY